MPHALIFPLGGSTIIDRASTIYTQLYTLWLPIRYVVCMTGKYHRNIYKAPTRSHKKIIIYIYGLGGEGGSKCQKGYYYRHLHPKAYHLQDRTVITYSRVRINWVRLPILLVVSSTGKINMYLFTFAPDNLISLDGFGSPVPRRPAHFSHTRDESSIINLVLTHGIPATFRGGVIVHYLCPDIGSVPIRVDQVTQLRTDGVQ